MIQSKENAQTDQQKDRWKDGQTLFYRTLPATAGGPKSYRVLKFKQSPFPKPYIEQHNSEFKHKAQKEGNKSKNKILN